jgi:hypothetical protein
MDKQSHGYRIHPVYQQRILPILAHNAKSRQDAANEALEIASQEQTTTVLPQTSGAPTSAILRNKQKQLENNTYSGGKAAPIKEKSKGFSYSIKLAIDSGAMYTDSC